MSKSSNKENKDEKCEEILTNQNNTKVEEPLIQNNNDSNSSTKLPLEVTEKKDTLKPKKDEPGELSIRRSRRNKETPDEKSKSQKTKKSKKCRGISSPVTSNQDKNDSSVRRSKRFKENSDPQQKPQTRSRKLKKK